VKHAGDEALNELEPLLVDLRAVDGLIERKRGVFYRRGKAFAHFHEDPTGLFVDVRLGSDFERMRVSTTKERASFLAGVRRAVGT
jgi:hypothetical protein